MNYLRLSAATFTTFFTVFVLTITLSMLPLAQIALDGMQMISRTPDDYNAHVGYLFGGHFLQALLFVVIYIGGYQGRGLKVGTAYGFLMGLFLAFTNVALYSAFDLKLAALIGWCISDVINFTAAGALISLILTTSESLEENSAARTAA